jgi:hydroxyacylglutathione hydrolase
MKIVQVPVGGIEANAYIVYKEGSGKAFVVDPGAECTNIMAQLDDCGIDEVTHILLTHGHFDHVGAVAEMKRATGAKVCIHTRDIDMLKSPKSSFAAKMGIHVPPCEPDMILKGGEKIDAAEMDVFVLHTPGHSGGSVCYLAEDALFAGDTLFYMACGRTDLPGGSDTEYANSLNTVLRSLKRDYIIYTGHGPQTTLFAEFRKNPFFKREK